MNRKHLMNAKKLQQQVITLHTSSSYNKDTNVQLNEQLRNVLHLF